MRPALWRSTLLILPLLGALVLAACGGDLPASQDDSSGKPPAAPVEPTLALEDLFDLARVTPIPPPTTAGKSDIALGGTSRPLERQISRSLTANGLTADVFVFSMNGLDQWLLVLELNEAQLAPLLTDPNVFMKAFGPLIPKLRENKITRIAMNFTTSDKDGPLLVTLTAPVSGIEASLAGTLSDADKQTLLQYETSRPSSR